MNLIINGEKRDVPDVEMLNTLMTRLNVAPEAKGVAVAINGTVVPRGEWPSTRLNTGDEIEVIHAVQGG